MLTGFTKILLYGVYGVPHYGGTVDWIHIASSPNSNNQAPSSILPSCQRCKLLTTPYNNCVEYVSHTHLTCCQLSFSGRKLTRNIFSLSDSPRPHSMGSTRRYEKLHLNYKHIHKALFDFHYIDINVFIAESLQHLSQVPKYSFNLCDWSRSRDKVKLTFQAQPMNDVANPLGSR